VAVSTPRWGGAAPVRLDRHATHPELHRHYPGNQDSHEGRPDPPIGSRDPGRGITAGGIIPRWRKTLIRLAGINPDRVEETYQEAVAEHIAVTGHSPKVKIWIGDTLVFDKDET